MAILVSAKGLGPVVLDVPMETVADMKIEMKPAVKLRGKVVDIHGEPLAGAGSFYANSGTILHRFICRIGSITHPRTEHLNLKRLMVFR